MEEGREMSRSLWRRPQRIFGEERGGRCCWLLRWWERRGVRAPMRCRQKIELVDWVLALRGWLADDQKRVLQRRFSRRRSNDFADDLPFRR
jgi:hypothetical protein